MSDDGERGDALRERVDAVARLVDRALDGDADARLNDAVPASDPLHPLCERLGRLIASVERERGRLGKAREQIEQHLTTIELQKAAMRELSTPLIEVWSGVLCLPIIGVMEGERCAQMVEHVLQTIVEKQVSHVVIDITGMHDLEGETLSQLLKMARAIKLLGGACVLTGIRPAAAQQLATQAWDDGGVTTLRSVREALQRILLERQARAAR